MALMFTIALALSEFSFFSLLSSQIQEEAVGPFCCFFFLPFTNIILGFQLELADLLRRMRKEVMGKFPTCSAQPNLD